MRPVTPFMMMPTVCTVRFVIERSLGLRLVGTLRHCALWQRRRFHARLRQRPIQFLTPMRYVTGRPVAVHHSQRSRTYIRKLVKHFRWDVNRLACRESCTLLAQAHLTFALNDEINFFLLLVVP